MHCTFTLVARNLATGLKHRSTIFRKSCLGVNLQSQRCVSTNQSNPQSPVSKRGRGKDNNKKGPISWKSLGITFAVGGAILGGMAYVKKEKELAIAKQRSRSIGQAALGGTWELVDHNGKAVKHSDFFGQWFIIYFGFCHCPDICPDELEKLSEAVDKVDALKSVPNLQPLFISIDPDRDTPAAIKEYVKDFSPKLIGLCGNKEQTHQVSRAYRVYYSQGQKDEDGGYIVDHTIVMYLVDPDGKFIDYYGQNKTADQIATSVMMHMQRFKQLKS